MQRADLCYWPCQYTWHNSENLYFTYILFFLFYVDIACVALIVYWSSDQVKKVLLKVCFSKKKKTSKNAVQWYILL